jgi:hypothetical protein
MALAQRSTIFSTSKPTFPKRYHRLYFLIVLGTFINFTGKPGCGTIETIFLVQIEEVPA